MNSELSHWSERLRDLVSKDYHLMYREAGGESRIHS
jgi:hypothetical protein